MHIVQMETREQILARLPATKKIVLTHAWRVKSWLPEGGWERGEELHNFEIILKDNEDFIHFLNPKFNGQFKYGKYSHTDYGTGKEHTFFEVPQNPPHDRGFTSDNDEGLWAYGGGFYNVGELLVLGYVRHSHAEAYGLRDISKHKLQPKRKPAAILSALADAGRPMTKKELQKVIGKFGSTTVLVLTGKWNNSGWSNIPLIHRVARGKYEITDLGIQALKNSGLR